MPKKQIEQIVLTDEQMREYMQQYDALMVGADKNASLPSKAQKLYKKCHKILQDYADGSWKKQSHDNVVLDNVNSELIEDFGLKFFLELGDDGKLKAVEGTNGGKSHSLTLLKNILARIASDKQNEDNDNQSDDEQLNTDDKGIEIIDPVS
ncbi:MAG: hypothetical protein MJ158_01805, partial [Alphaproteobacteria bacterium]|nr:hypothetical protein [Alphaproteobacteria bacterium]